MAVLLTLILTIPTVFFATLIWASPDDSPISDAVLESGSQVETASYVVFKDGSVYYVKNGLTGVIDYSGTNASYVFNSIIQNNTKIFVTDGDYYLDSTILIQSKEGVSLQGTGFGSKLIATNNSTIIEIGDRDAHSPSTGITIRDLYLDGSAQGQGGEPEFNDECFGIEISSRYEVAPESTTDITIENCYIYNTGSDGIYGWHSGEARIRANTVDSIRNYWAGIHAHGTHLWVITNNLLKNFTTGQHPAGIRHGYIINDNKIVNTGAGIVGADHGGTISGNHIYNVTAYGIYSWGDDTTISGNYIRYCGERGIWISNDGGFEERDRVIVDGNVVERADMSGIYIENVDRVTVSDNTVFMSSQGGNGSYSGIDIADSARCDIHDNQIKNVHGGGLYNLLKYGIAENGASDYNRIHDNFIYGFITGDIDILGAHSTTFGNVIEDKPSENSGTSTGTGSQQTIAHGLAGTPTLVLLSPPTTNARETASAGATNIYITADNTEAYYWYVEYHP